LQNLRWLAARGSPITDRGLAELQGLSSLLFLDISHTKVSGVGFVGFRTPLLEELHAKDAPISDEGLQFIAELPRLTFLDLGNTSITDTGVRHLGEAPFLTDLLVNGTQITVGTLPLLQKIPRLRNVFLGRTPAARARPLGFEEDLPGVRVLGN
jgi:Leucine-rich repeat (LRR) protein